MMVRERERRRKREGSGGRGKPEGWEEARGEFYQEAYSDNSTGRRETGKRPSQDDVEAMLPSRQPGATVRRKNVRRASLYKTGVNRRQSPTAELNYETLPDLSGEDVTNEADVWEQLQGIKSMALPMARKREHQRKIKSKFHILKSSGFQGFSLQGRKARQNLALRFQEQKHWVTPFHSSLRQIEGHYGTGIVSYFVFLRWLLLLNVLLGVLVVIFIMVPVAVVQDDQYTTPNATDCSKQYIDEVEKYKEGEDLLDKVSDAVKGTGWLERTYLFYGFYPNIYLNIVGSELTYNFPLAYMGTVFFIFLLTFLLIVHSAAKGFQESLMISKGSFNEYCNIFFAGWDFCIFDKSAALTKKRGIMNEVKSLISAERLRESIRRRTKWQRIALYLIRICMSLVALGILGGCGFLIFVSAGYSLDKLSNSTDEKTIDGIPTIFYSYLPTFVITMLNMVIPMFFSSTIRVEKYAPLTVIKVLLIRTLAVRISSIFFLLVSFHSMIKCTLPDNGCVDESCKTPLCWETYVGQQMYRLVLFDFIIRAITLCLLALPRSMITRCLSSKTMKAILEVQFDLPQQVLDLVYGQTLCWLGTFFSPLIPVISLFKLCFLFYMMKFYLYIICVPPTTGYRASRTNSYFFAVLLVSFIIIAIPLGYMIASINPSRACGPFQGQEYMWDIVVTTVSSWPKWTLDVISFLNTAAFIIPVIVLLSLMLYYYWAVAGARRAKLTMLREHLILEGKDKHFLLTRLHALLKKKTELESEPHS
ncbi:unnamed protein product [Darwinula stevensoni]|uniref:TMC domain-containing protein n=1 Tax=Darwinula stevensoni TaxID=69355 RepID=A0A7R9A7S1_9CRUS|nr:unnamed protein product [Darwinula stevensoni]CAG0893214.1 unnamed protein product [Darwinula stevensoni]